MSQDQKKRNRMVNITIALPDIVLQGIEKLVEMGLFHTRSEFIREAIRERIFEEKIFQNSLEGVVR